MKPSLFSGGDDFLSEIVHNKSNLGSIFILFLEDFIEEELEEGFFQSLRVSSTRGFFLVAQMEAVEWADWEVELVVYGKLDNVVGLGFSHCMLSTKVISDLYCSCNSS